MSTKLPKQFLFVVGLLLLTYVVAQSQLHQTSVAEALQKNFGTSVEAVSAFRPFYVTGDFNGDGAQDIAVVVRLKAPRSTLPKDVRLLNPFESPGPVKYPANPAKENKLAVVVMHGWNDDQATAKFLLLGESPALILEPDRVSLQLDDRKGLIALMSKRGKRRKGESFPRGARGDVILLGTEVGGDSLLYWNGRTYVWEDVAED